MPLYAVFYANDEPLALAVREETRRPGQAWDTVPSHCAALVTDPFGRDWIYEFLVTGWNKRCVDSRDTWRVEVPDGNNGGDMRSAWAFAQGCNGGRYDWDAVFCSYLNEHLPPGLRITDNFPHEKDCSRFVPAVLLAYGTPLPPALVQDCPSPNDLLQALGGMSPIGEVSTGVKHG
jgi:hypothetical protein